MDNWLQNGRLQNIPAKKWQFQIILKLQQWTNRKGWSWQPLSWNPILVSHVVKNVIESEKKNIDQKDTLEDVPGSAVDKNLPANAGDMGSVCGPGRFHMPQSN